MAASCGTQQSHPCSQSDALRSPETTHIVKPALPHMPLLIQHDIVPSARDVDSRRSDMEVDVRVQLP